MINLSLVVWYANKTLFFVRSSLSAVPSAPESAEEAISLLQLLRADRDVCSAGVNLLDSKISQSAAHVQYYTYLASKAINQLQRAELAVGYGRMMITRSGYLYEATVGRPHC